MRAKCSTAIRARFETGCVLDDVGNVAVLTASDHAVPMTGTVANMTCGQIVG